MDSELGKITPSTISTIPIPRMDMGFNNYDSTITKRQMSKDPKKENNFGKNSSNFDWDAFRYKNTIPQGIFLPQTIIYNTSH
jgi:hypothetical protein